MQKPNLAVQAIKLLRLKGSGIGPRAETCVNWGGPTAMVPCLHQGNIDIKRNYGHGEIRNVFTLLVQKRHLAVRAVKLPHLNGGGIGPRTRTCINWGELTAMVPCLHQGNNYMN